MFNKEEISVLIKKAIDSSKNSYSPYSKFPVGCAFEDTEGNIYGGCNVENLAFPSGICAERTAICKAISKYGPKLKIKTLIVYTPTQNVTTPCGTCRQVMNEFSTNETRIVCVCDSELYLDTTLKKLLPESPKIDFE